MIKLEHTVLHSSEQMKFIIEGMRNPMNSWEKSDSKVDYYDNWIAIGEKDYNLMQKLAQAGTDHRKFMRMIPVYARITAPLYWWKEFDTYKIGTVTNSCSTMHKIQEKEFTLDDFSHEHLVPRTLKKLKEDICELNFWQGAYNCKSDEERNLYFANCEWNETYIPTKNDCWWQMIQLLPSPYNQTRNVMLNYEVLANIYPSRKNHKLDEWREFCKWIENLPYSELIMLED